ncbi:myosin-8-like [Sebastes umbrosus]|uniref:myosin-8-like n=1 Tax=Sebastes umbrosus TaxID=72105 RepID=UPI00189F48E8|nr:myosin-8-like [Sebastes umbrosus]XP_037637269.1 myosin-8-like [Sebastes umbrosus]
MRRTVESRDKSNNAEMEESRRLNVSEEWLPTGFYVQSEAKTHAELQVVEDLKNQLTDARTQLKREIEEKEMLDSLTRALQGNLEDLTKKNNTKTGKLETEKLGLSVKVKDMTAEIARLQFLDNVIQAENDDLKGLCHRKEFAAQQDKHELLEKIAELTHLNQTMQKKNKNLSAEVQDREKRDDYLNRQDKTIRDELAQHESQILQNRAETEDLREKLKEVQEKETITADENQRLIGKVAHLEALRQKEAGRQATMLDLHKLISDKDEEIQKLTCAGEKLSRAKHDLQKSVVSLTEQNKSSTNELTRLESLAAKLNEEKRNLQKAERDLRIQVEVDNEQIHKMDEHITNQTRQIAYNQEQLVDYHILTTDLRQKVADLTDQLEAKTEEEILASVEQQRDEISFETTPEDYSDDIFFDATPEDQSDDIFFEATSEDQIDGIFVDATPQDQSDDIFHDATSEDQSGESLLGSLASVFCSRSFWWRSATLLVNVGVLIIAVKLGLPNIPLPYCNHIVPPPF